MAFLKDGRLFVADGTDGAVYLLDPQSAAISRLGRTGSGPGEYRRPEVLGTTDQGRIVVRDMQQFRVISWNRDGSLHASSRISRNVLKGLFYVVLGAALGYVSAAVWPYPFFAVRPSPIVSLVLVPLAVGFAAVSFSKVFEDKWEWDIDTSRFFFAFLLALVIAGTRFMLI